MSQNIEFDPKQLIVYEHDDLLVVYKPSGIISEEDPKCNINLRYLIHNHIKQTYPWKKQLICELAHRIDRPVSGLLVCAKKKSILEALQKQFYLRTVGKYYLAIIEGGHRIDPEGTLEHYMAKDPIEFRSVVVTADHPEAKLARLSYRIVASRENTSLVRIQLYTGRFHQIRLQFSEMGTPIWNDVWYNGTKQSQEAHIGLHAYRLEFDMPKTNERKRFIKAPEFRTPWSLYDDEINALIHEESRHPIQGRPESFGEAVLP